MAIKRIKMKIKVCMWSACKDRFSEYIITRLKNDKQIFNIDDLIIEESLCMWECKKWPNINVDWNIYNYITPVKASEFVFYKNKKKKKTNKNIINNK